MINQIEIQHCEKTLAVIEMRNHPFIDEWFEHWKYVNNNYPSMVYTSDWPPNLSNHSIAETIIENIQVIKDAGNNCNKLTKTHIFPYTEETFPSIDIFIKKDLTAQKYLNEFHRYFTTGVQYPHTRDLYDNGMISDLTYTDAWFAEIQKINQAVHKIDDATITPNVKCCPVIKRLNFGYEIHNKDMYLQESTFKKISTSQLVSASDDSKEWNVWMAVDLLGKDYPTGFINHDDANAWDIDYLNTYTGAFTISTNNITYVDICKSDGFSDWLSLYNKEYNSTMCGIPLGKTTYLNKEILSSNYDCRKITLNNLPK